MRGFTNTLFEAEPDDALQHCTNNPNCICARSHRAQGYRQLALALHQRGRNSQVQWRPPVLAFYRAGWFHDSDVPKNSPCPPLDAATRAALETEPNPSSEAVERFLEVPRRVSPLPS
jgi:hypothetical protein